MIYIWGQGVFGQGVFGGSGFAETDIGGVTSLGVNGYSATLALDPTTGDMIFPPTIAKGDDAIIQSVYAVLRFFEGEWFLDTRQGIPFIRRIFVKNPSFPTINAIFRQGLLTIPQVAQVVSFSTYQLDEDKQTRNARADFECVLDDSRRLTGKDEPLIISAL